ncbi:MAG: DinB family protein [Vicinamibacterales bacterium]
MSMTQAFLQEFDQEAKTTRRVLERVPADKFAWKPHPKSMSLGELAMHTALTPGAICGWACEEETNVGSGEKPPVATSTADLVAAHDKSVEKMKETMGQLGDGGLMKNWKASAGGQTIFEMPKGALIRSIALNHWYHHRGQLSVYLRLLDVPVPSIYGPSADENPFAARA